CDVARPITSALRSRGNSAHSFPGGNSNYPYGPRTERGRGFVIAGWRTCGRAHALEHMANSPRLPLKKVGMLVREHFLREVDRKSFHAEFGPQDKGFD